MSVAHPISTYTISPFSISWQVGDGLASADDGDFICPPNTLWGTDVDLLSCFFPEAVTIRKLLIDVNSESLDALSVNTLTLVVGGADTSLVGTYTDSTGTGTKETLGTVTANANDLWTLRWNSDSTGDMVVRAIGLAGVYS